MLGGENQKGDVVKNGVTKSMDPIDIYKPKNDGDGNIRCKNAKSATLKKNQNAPLKKPNTSGGVTRKTITSDTLTKLKNRYGFLVKKFRETSRDINGNEEKLKQYQKQLLDVKDNILEINCKEHIELPEFKSTITSQRGDSGDGVGNEKGHLHLQREYNKIFHSLTEATAIKKELNEQLFISEKQCRELQRQLDEERNYKPDICKAEYMKLLKEKEELEKKVVSIDEINYQKFLAEEENEKVSQVNDSLKIEMSNIRKKNQDLEQELSEIKKMLDIPSDQSRPGVGLRMLQEDNNTLKEVVNKIRGEYRVLQQEYNDLKNEFDLLFTHKDKNCLEAKQLTDELYKAKQEAEKYKRESDCFQKELKNEIKEKAEMMNTLNKFKVKMANEAAEKARLKIRFSDKGRRSDDSLLLAQFRALQEDNQKILMEMENKDEEYQKQINKFEQKIHEYMSEIKSLSSTTERYQRNKERLESEIKSLKHKLTGCDKKIRACRCIELKNDLKRQNHKARALHKKLKSIVYKYQMLKDELQRAKKNKQDGSSTGLFKQFWITSPSN